MTLSDSLDHRAGNPQLAGEDASTPMGSNRWAGLQGDAQNLLFYLRGQHRPRPLPLLPLVKGFEPLRVAITVGRDSPVRWAMARVGIPWLATKITSHCRASFGPGASQGFQRSFLDFVDRQGCTREHAPIKAQPL